MSEVANAVSMKPWEPIWDVRTRSDWVQATILDLLRQLRALRNMSATLPSIDTIELPPLRQLRVVFGDLVALCDAIEFIHNYNASLGAAYGGPDEKGMLWIKFYQMRKAERPWEKPLQFIIWVDSMRPSTIALDHSSHLVSESIALQAKTRERGSEATPATSDAWCQSQSTWVEKNWPTCRRLAPMLLGSVQS